MAEISRLFVGLCWKKYALRFLQNRNMSSTFREEKAIEELRKNPYYEKYSMKISAFQNTSPEEFKTRLEEHHKQESVVKEGSGKNRKFSPLSDPKEGIAKFPSPTFTKQKELKDVMKMELIAGKECSEIKQIWEEYHKQKAVIAAAIPSDIYDVIHSRSLQFPVAHKENAPECLSVTHYIELKEKGLVLMRGQYDKDVLNGTEAKCLANQLQLYYGQDNAKRLKLLERFTYTPEEFKHMDLVADLECLSL